MKPRNNLLLGHLGEKEAEKYLTSQNYRIIARNFRTRNGEIDIVAIDGNTTVFVEVKTRRNTYFGLPQESVNKAKIRFLSRAAHYYKLTHQGLPDSMRIDVVAILLDDNDEISKIDQFKNITL